MRKTVIKWMLLLSMSCFSAAQSIDHVIFVIKENRSTDEMFGTFPGVQNYCQGGNSPLRCTNDQAKSCTTVRTHDVCGNGGWCEPLQCTTPSGPECSAGDTCPQITTGRCYKGSGTKCPATGAYIPLADENPNTTNPDVTHTQAYFLQELYRGNTSAAMEWSPGNAGTQGGMAYFKQTDIPYYYQLASTYGLADNHFSTMGGPSQPNHAYLFAASSGEWSDNPVSTKSGASSDPGYISGFNSTWYCGAKHSGSSPPYTYVGTEISTQASDGTQYYAGVCSNHQTTSCSCKCAAGKKCANTFSETPCSTDDACTELGDTCTTAYSIGGSQGAPCLKLTTIADQIEAVLGTGANAWGYYSHNNFGWVSPAYFQNIYFNSSRWETHIHQDTQFDSDVAKCSGMCRNNHSLACTKDSECGGGNTCIDSDGTPAGSTACMLPKVAYVSPTLTADADHAGLGSMSQGQSWTHARLVNYFSNPYVYAHSIVLLTWDDWGGYYDHVPPPMQDNVPTLGFRVPLICIGPYCKNKVTHTQFEFASELKCMEHIFHLSSINSRDAEAIDACAGTGTLESNTDGMVDTAQTPIPPL